MIAEENKQLGNAIWWEVDRRREAMIAVGAPMEIVGAVDELARLILGSMPDPAWGVCPKERLDWLLEECIRIIRYSRERQEVTGGATYVVSGKRLPRSRAD